MSAKIQDIAGSDHRSRGNLALAEKMTAVKQQQTSIASQIRRDVDQDGSLLSLKSFLGVESAPVSTVMSGGALLRSRIAYGV